MPTQIPVDEHAFRVEVLTRLTSIDEKVDSLVGTDTNKGRVSKLEDDVENLKTAHNRWIGMGMAWGTVITVLGAVWHYLVHGAKTLSGK